VRPEEEHRHGFVALVDSLDEKTLQPVSGGHPTRWRIDRFADMAIVVILRPIILSGPVEKAAGWALFDQTGHAIWIEPFRRSLVAGGSVHIPAGGHPSEVTS
jgi:hypothetical protein